MGLADELTKLAELKKEGLLSEEEFLEAKKKVINGGGSSSSAEAAPAPAPEPFEATANYEALITSSSMAIAVQDATELLTTILQNVSKNPTEKKFRILKLQNEKLSTRLFPVEGVVEFLESIGFDHHPEQGTYELLNTPTNLSDILIQLSRVTLIREVREKERARKELQASIRKQKREDNKNIGNTTSFTKSELMCSCGDLEDKYKWMTRILKPVADSSPDDEAAKKFRKVKLTPKFYSECWSRHGTQEFLLDIAGWEETDEGTHIVCNTSEQVQQEAIQYLTSILNEYQEKERTEEEEKRNAARREIKDLIERRRKSKQATPVVPSGKKIPISEALKQLTGQASNREELATAERIISDIAGMVERHSPEESMVNIRRKEFHRLREKFAADGDLAYLHNLRDEWEAKMTPNK
eukprot:TRINITY_DN18247_c0_g1_i1.p1 TRINITY_DN18247_c0_g1~~TRINITY_DN18247_c0_g1_i1.p1  ORF type:complete len:412 (+),score=112.90 TRINITY_DN18247_c0_g1_i1:56-1291(+)